MNLSLRIITLVLLATATSLAAAADAQKAVLVTGATSGIGRNIAERLAGEGHFVYAGARKQADIDELNEIENVMAVRLDVTSDEDIAAAVELVLDEKRGLYGIVNNAGVAVFSPMNQTPEEDIHFVMNVNVLGPYRINKAFAPLLEESGGRTTTIGSISGFIAGPTSGTYSMSKFAIEAYTDALAAELADSGVRVSVVEPGGYKSKIREKVVARALDRADDGTVDLSDEDRVRMESVVAQNETLKEPDEVADAAVHALFSDSPRHRYMVTPNAQQADVTIRSALRRVVQLNADQPYSYDRDELIEILDELLDE